jgi:signal transduction histidine kinase
MGDAVVDKDEYRLRVQLSEPQRLLDALRKARAEPGERDALGRVATTHEGGHVFLYCDSAQSAETIREAVRRLLDEHRIEADLTLWRWHPLEERWEDAAAPLPSTAAQLQREHERRIEAEDEESRESPYAEWEVRVSLHSHHDAHALAERLRAEGVPCRRYWRHLLLGAPDEDAAALLAARVRSEAPDGSEAVVEAVGQPIWEAMHPYAVFGGLGV